jgi:hypothetical protein
MKKIAYKNKLYEKAKPISGEIPSTISAEEGCSANFPNIGRGYSMPGEQAIPISDSDEPVFLKKREKKNPPVDYERMLNLFVELGDEMDKKGEHDLASFADFLITKIAQQKEQNYEILLKQLIVNIANSDLLNKNNLIISIGRLYNQRYLSLLDELDDKDAHREAYQDVFSLAEKEVGGKDE